MSLLNAFGSEYVQYYLILDFQNSSQTTTRERWLENAAYFDLRNIAWTRRLAKKIALQLACDDVIVYARTVVGFVKNAGMPGPKSCLATITFASGSYCSSSNICSTTDSLVSGKMWHTSPGLYRMLDSDMSQTKCLQCVIGMCVCAYMRVCVGVCVCTCVHVGVCVRLSVRLTTNPTAPKHFRD